MRVEDCVGAGRLTTNAIVLSSLALVSSGSALDHEKGAENRGNNNVRSSEPPATWCSSAANRVDNERLLNEIRKRQVELCVTFECATLGKKVYAVV
jgi:hypothetical protein